MYTFSTISASHAKISVSSFFKMWCAKILHMAINYHVYSAAKSKLRGVLFQMAQLKEETAMQWNFVYHIGTRETFRVAEKFPSQSRQLHNSHFQQQMDVPLNGKTCVEAKYGNILSYILARRWNSIGLMDTWRKLYPTNTCFEKSSLKVSAHCSKRRT